MDRPEVGRGEANLPRRPHVVENERRCDDVEQSGHVREVVQPPTDNGADLEREQVDAGEGEDDAAVLVGFVKARLLVLQIDEHDVRPVPEDGQVNHHGQPVEDVVDQVPVAGLVVDHDLDAL